MVDAIARACADAHAHAQPGADLGIVKGKGKGDVPSVRQEDIIRSVDFPFLFLSLSVLSRSCLTYIPLIGDDLVWPRRRR